MAARLHDDGRPYGMTKRDFWKQQRGIDIRCPMERQIAANKFNADVKSMGLTEAMAAHGITE